MTKREKLLDLRQQLEDILEKMLALKGDIEEVNQCMLEERFISTEISSVVIEKLQEIQRMHEKCQNIYIGMEVDTEMPVYIETARSTVEAEIRKAEIDEKYGKFLYITTAEEELSALLLEKQEELRGLLENYSEEKEQELELFAKFANAMTETDSIQLLSYIMELTPVFGNILVAKAFIEKALVLEKSPEELEVQAEGCEAEDGKVQEQALIEENIITEEIFVSEENSTVIDNSLVSKEIVLSDTTENDKEQKDYYDTLSENGLLITEDVYSEEFFVDTGNENKKFKVKAFMSDMNSNNNIVLNMISLRCAKEYNSMLPELMSLVFDVKKEKAEFTLDYLIYKGYIRKYGITGLGSFYCLSPRGEKAFQTKESKNFLKFKGSVNKSSMEIIEDSLHPILTRITYAKLFYKYLEILGSKSQDVTGMIWSEFCGAKILHKRSEKLFGFVAAYWLEGKEVSDFLQEIKEHYVDEYENLLVGGLNLEIAKKQAGLLVENLHLEADKIYYYSLLEDACRSFAEDKECTLDEILAVSDDDDPDDDLEELNLFDEEDEDAFVENFSNETENYTDFLLNSDEEVQVHKNIYQMIVSNQMYCATTYLRSMMEEDAGVKDIYEKLAYAVNAPWMKCSYNSQMVFTLYGDCEDVFSKYLLVAAAMRNFFMNHVSYDYEMKALYNSVKDLDIVSSNIPLTKAIYRLVAFKERIHKGINFYADYKLKDKVELERELKQLSGEAKAYYDSYVLGYIKENTSNKRFIKTRKLIFAQNGDFAEVLKIVMEQKYEKANVVSAYLQENFMRDDANIDISNMDYNKLNAFIDEYWAMAGSEMLVARMTSDLMSSLRNNLLNAVEKVMRVMCDWTLLVEESGDLTSDEGSMYYKEVRKELLDNLKGAQKSLKKKHSKMQLAELAGVITLEQTLEEFIARLDGSFQEKMQKYFYIDFLRGKNVLLDEDYLPDLKGKFGVFKELSLTNRVLLHSKEKLMSFKEKLDDIFHNYGDDYGTAELIIRYLEDIGENSFDYSYDVQSSQEIAQQDAENKFHDFIENLELAQSYGQIAETKENKKEKIQKIVSEWFDYAKESKNYGFFFMVLEMYRTRIQEEAKVRGTALLQELTQIKEKEKPDEKMKAKICKIEEMIEKQNYTVAEDLLSRIHLDESEEDAEIAGTDYLKKFMEGHDLLYKSVADSSRKLSAIVSLKSHNKDEKGGRKLIDNWMSNGQPLGEAKLNILLDALGFFGARSKVQPKIGKIENYLVEMQEISAGRKVNYRHFITAFGSKAREEGFRVVCLFGKYDADRLIEEFKNIAGTKNTLVLLDYALPLSERRKLARKVKADLGDKVYAVLDRVLLMFLVNNYNVQFINQILMSTMMPFAYYQPYVWDSSKVMPPEMFIGRKEELEKIQSPTGVNIVYGGRQLGKSALLKMAKMNVDKDENQNRAILVEIKGLNYEKAALKIGRELYSAGILETSPETTDWDELAYAVKRRLQSTTLPHIPYLLLLLDEADAFIDSCESVNYQPFDALKDIQSVSVGMDRFKFVIAGLHNIVRFKRDAALSNNSVLTQLTSITIKPFDKRDAKALLIEPLTYLGFRFPEEKQALVSLILASTNYFPGLIQLYCANLVESMRKNDYGGYEQACTPEYEINETLIKKVLADPDFMAQIREKFEITLKMDDDNMYYLLALLLAYLYHQNVNSASESEGFSAKDIMKASEELYIKKISALEEDKINGFLQELLELNILRQTISELYLFSRYSFFQMMGTATEVENKLVAYMEE